MKTCSFCGERDSACTCDSFGAIRPPIGLMPRWRWMELRLKEVEGAIARYEAANKAVPEEWRNEVYGLPLEIAEEFYERKAKRSEP